MLRGLVIPDRPHDQPPDHPVVRVCRLHHYGFLYFLDGLSCLPVFEEGKGPVTVALVVAFGMVHLGLVAYLDCLGVVLVHVVDESQIVVCVVVPWVYLDADFQVFVGHRVLLLFEVGQPEVVL